MKVLFISSGKDNGKPGPIVYMQGISLEKEGVEVEYFTTNMNGLGGYLNACLRLRKHLRKNKFDLIHAHYGLIAIIALFGKKKHKLIVSFMGDDLVGTNRPDGSITRLSMLFARFNVFLGHKFYNYNIVKSTEMLQKFSGYKVSLIPNGVDVDLFRPMDMENARLHLGLSLTEKILIFVSDPSRTEKNFPLAQRAASLCAIENLRLLPVYGVSSSDLVYYYNAADALALTSFHEGSPNVIKEAMACNCPIVSTPVGDVPQVLESVKTCYLASWHENDFAEKIRDVLSFVELGARSNGRERILSLGLDSGSIAKKIITVYKNCIE